MAGPTAGLALGMLPAHGAGQAAPYSIPKAEALGEEKPIMAQGTAQRDPSAPRGVPVEGGQPLLEHSPRVPGEL